MKVSICCLATIIYSLGIPAQVYNPLEKRSSLSFTAGVNIPIMCYAYKTPAKNTAGFAHTGFSLGLSYTWRLTTHTGLKALVYYAHNKAGTAEVPALAGAGHYRMTGLMLGPRLLGVLGEKWEAGFSPYAGISRVWTPSLSKQELPVLYRQDVFCFSWGGDLSLQYHISENHFLRLQTGHLNMKPRLDNRNDSRAKGEQHIVLMTLDAGMGWKF